jgi:hypothetical protein
MTDYQAVPVDILAQVGTAFQPGVEGTLKGCDIAQWLIDRELSGLLE